MIVAACQYAIELFVSWEHYEQHLTALVKEAAEEGAELLLLPEYSAMTLTGQLAPDIRGDLHRSIEAMQSLLPQWLALCEELARKLHVVFCPGSAPVKDADGQFRNRAYLFGPNGLIGHQDKQIMTRFEREIWHIDRGLEGLKSFETPLGKLGILICYDVEFPMLARRLAEEEVDLILAPSCTDTLAGAYRVRIGAQARALESQIAILTAPTAGDALWSPAVDENKGRAALYVPPDYGMPASGVFAQSMSDDVQESNWLIIDVDLEAVAKLRTEGQVATRRDWVEQFEQGIVTRGAR